MPPFTRLGIVGIGLIGGSIALAAERRWPGASMIGIDRADRLDDLRRRVPTLQMASDAQALAGADLIVLAAPVSQNLAVLAQLPAILTHPVLITDTGSTKRAIVDAAASLPPHLRFVGGHPIAGDARSGAAAARTDLFDDRPWLLTPCPAQSAFVPRLIDFVEGLGGRPAILDADAHDRILAYVSHLPQLTASALMDVVGSAVGESGLAYAGAGLTDTTRLAASAPAIWRDIAATNAAEIGPALDALIAVLRRLRDDLDSGETLEEMFLSAARWREGLVKQQ